MTDREMIDQWLIVDLGCSEVSRLTDNATLNADSAVGYVYVDSICGITFNVEAWCIAAGECLRAVSRPSDNSQRIMLRYGSFAGKRMRLLTVGEMTGMALPSVPDWHQYYCDEDNAVLPLRSLSLLDPFRAPGFPDDIKCLLLDDTRGKDGEWVWAKLIRQAADGLFVCRLLNEPFQDFGLHEGDLLKVAVSERGAFATIYIDNNFDS